ncbi:MAG: reverse transcriptase domain-containing protein, partial [Candidatus Saccharimonadales bacterium]
MSATVSSTSTIAGATGSASLYTVEKLNSSNFSHWKQRLQMILMDRGLWELVDGSEPAPVVRAGDEASQQKLKEWRKRDQAATAQIGLTVSNSELSHIKGAKTARATWNKICDVYEVKGLQALIFLKRKFYTVKMKEGDAMQTHINHVRQLADELEAIGCNVSDSDLAVTLLSSLPSQYDPLIMAMEARNIEELTSEYVAVRLLAEEKRKQESAEDNLQGTSETAFMGKSNLPARAASQKRPKCTYCKRFGHTEDVCRKKHGHPRDRDTPVTAATASLNEAASINDDAEYAAFTSTLDATADHCEWLIDSGASGHYCNNRAWFQTIRDIPPKSVTLGDNRVIHATAIGKIPISLRVGNRVINGMINEVFFVPDIGVNLLSVPKLVQAGLHVIFEDTHCTISNKAGKILGRAWRGAGHLYRLSLQPSFTGNLTASVSQISRPDFSENVSCESLASIVDIPADQCCNVQCQSSHMNVSDFCGYHHHQNDIVLWHKRLGHLNLDSMKTLVSRQLVTDFALDDATHESRVTDCEACIKGKTHRKPMPYAATHHSTRVLQLVHSDVCGPINTATLGGAKYFVTFIDDYSRYVVVKLMKSKGEVLDHFRLYKAWAENVTGKCITVFRTDGGGEYFSKAFDQLLGQSGIARQKSPAYTPQHNGVAERANRTIVECARSMLQEASLDYSYWGEAVMTATYIRNRCPTKSLPAMTPYEAWTGKKPSLAHLRVWGCKAYAHVPKETRTKLQPKAIECVFVGYSLESKAYRLHDPISNRLLISRDVTFLEDHSYQPGTQDVEVVSGKGEHDSTVDTTVSHSPINSSSDNIPTTAPLSSLSGLPRATGSTECKQSQPLVTARAIVPRSSLSSLPSPNTHMSAIAVISNPETHNDTLYALLADTGMDGEPTTYAEAMARPDAKQWEQAAQEEYRSIQSAGTWTLVPLPPGRKAIGSKWVFKIKHNAAGSVERKKARLCAKGYSQKPGVDYHETFAPVARFSSIRVLLALAAVFDWEIHQMDVQTAFLNGDLTEDIYMTQPEGFVVKGKETLVCKLSKSLYGLKQASRAWNQKMDQCLLGMKFSSFYADPCVYVFRHGNVIMLVAMYVDDLLLLSNSLSRLVSLKQDLAKKFSMKDMGEAHFILGIEITRDRSSRTLSLSQKAYIKKVVERFNMTNSKPVATPLDAGTKLSTSDSPSDVQELAEMKKIPYRSAVGALMYAMVGTRPDIAFAVTTLSQYGSNPGLEHWSA